MSYTKTTWVNGDVITAEKLNNMEDGITSNNTLIVTYSYDENDENDDTAIVCDTSYSDIHQALKNNRNVIALVDNITYKAILYPLVYSDTLDPPPYEYIQFSNLNITPDSGDSTILEIVITSIAHYKDESIELSYAWGTIPFTSAN